MIVSCVFSRIKAVLLAVVAVLRRGFCCLSRRRKSSLTGCEVLSSVSVVQHDGNHHSCRNKEFPERDWNSWDDTPRTVDEHIEQYRQRLVKPKTPPPQDSDLDFFQDMTPKIVKQTKVLIKTESSPPSAASNFSRLQATSAANIPIVQSAELEDWDDDDASYGWDEASDEATKALIREKRREMRAQRKLEQQQQRVKKAQMQNTIGESSRRH